MEQSVREKSGTCLSEVRLPELIKHVDRLMLSSEKKYLQDNLLLLDKDGENSTYCGNDIVGDFGRKLRDASLSNDHLRTVLKLYQYHLHEERLLQELEDECTNGSSANKDKSRDICLPKIVKDQWPLRPTALLDRVLNHHKMKREIVIPTMVLKDSNSSRSSCGTSAQQNNSRTTEKNATTASNKIRPHFNYAHDAGLGNRRNLPGQPELIRLLTDPEISLHGDEAIFRNSEQNRPNQLALMSLYGGNMSPPLIDKQKQRKPRKRRIVCKFCRRQPGDHQKWCIYYNFGKIQEEKTLDFSRSHTEDEIELKKPSLEKTPELERSKTSMDDYIFQPDLPDHRPLHRDVYIRALADARARILMTRTHDYMNQLTKPFVFSYFTKLNGPKIKRNKMNGMEHIFGTENTDFTQYYKLFVNASKLK